MICRTCFHVHYNNSFRSLKNNNKNIELYLFEKILFEMFCLLIASFLSYFLSCSEKLSIHISIVIIASTSERTQKGKLMAQYSMYFEN